MNPRVVLIGGILGALSLLIFGFIVVAAGIGSSGASTGSGGSDGLAGVLSQPSGEKEALLIFSADWCPPCKAMRKSVYPDATVQATRSSVEWVYLDIDTAEGKVLAETLGINSVPTFVRYSADGKELRRQSGGMSPSVFVDFVTR